MLKAIVRINIGKHDNYREDEYANNDWDSIVFTDLKEDDYRSWSGDKTNEVVTIEDFMFPEKLSNKRKSSLIGITALSFLKATTSVDYDLVVWLEGSDSVIGNLNEFVDKVHKGEVSSPIHPECQSASDDAVKILDYEKDTYANLTSTLKWMYDNGFFQNNGYHETSGMIKSNTKYAHDLEEMWARMYLLGSTNRDQITLSLSRWICAYQSIKDKRFHGYSKTMKNGYFK